MKTKSALQKISFSVAAITVSACFALLSACTDDSAIHENVPADSGSQPTGDGAVVQQDGGTVVIGPDSSIAVDCYEGDATTYEQIINACTNATKIDKHPTLPLLLADGGRPSLP